MASWLEGEPELVALLMSWEPSPPHAISETVDSADEESSEAQARDEPNGRRRVGQKGSAHVNQSREREKQEIAALTRLVGQLERELQQQKQRRNQILRPHGSAPPSSALLAWENMATRHYQARRRAEKLNGRLRAMLKTQQSVADSFRTAIRRAEQARQDAFATALFSMDPSAGSLLDSVLFAKQQQLAQRLVQTSKQAYLPFARYAPFYSMPSGTRMRDLYFFNADGIHDSGTDAAFDIHSSSAYPFPAYLVEAALWKYFDRACIRDEEFSHQSECDATENALQGQLQSTSTRDSTQRRFTAHASRRRFRNADGELMIVSANCGKLTVTTPAAAKSSSSSQHVVEALVMEDSWVRILDLHARHRTRDASAAAADATPITVVQHARRSRLQFHGSARLSTRSQEDVKAALVAIADAQIRWGQEALEQSLMAMARDQDQRTEPIVV